MNRLIVLFERVVLGVGIFAALLLVPLVLATTWEVVSRYALNAPTIWAYEIGYLLTGSHFLLGLAYTL
ncbi:MAG: C4-dicarboxylate ABC transporter substrate-binding protein, partial [Methylibium sp.]|nr:C4-dicarboxylate ABC transporter substrate-binding protein [Methylibium sp.]